MRTFLLFILVFTYSFSYAQITFQKTYGGTQIDYGSDITATADGGFIISGYGESFSSGNDDFYLIKTDAFGNEEWARSIGYPSDPERADEVVILADGSYAIGGSSWLGINSVMTSRFDSQGNHLWTRHISGASCFGYFKDMLPTADTGLVVLSEMCNLSGLIRYNQNGDTLWTSNFGISSFDPIKMIKNVDGNYIIMSGDAGNAATDGILLMEFNDMGDSLWSKTFHTPLGFYGLDIIQASDSSYYITGYADGGTVNDIMLFKINKNRNAQWVKTYTGPNHDYGRAITEDFDGNLMIFNDTYSHSGGPQWDYMLSKVDTAGNLIWTNTYGGNSQEYAWAIEQQSDSTYALMGVTYSYGQGSNDLFFLRTTIDGLSGCNELAVTPGTSSVNVVEIPSNIGRYNGLNVVAAPGTPTISNITLSPVTQCANFAAYTITNDASCYANCDGVGICIVDGGNAPYTFLWDDPSMQTTDTATGLCAGNYTVRIIDGLLDTIYQQVVIGEPTELMITTSNDTTICNGDIANLSASGALNYSWDNGAGTGNTVSVNPSVTTNYTVIASDVNSCTDTAQVLVTVNALPDVSVTPATNLLTANNSNSGVSYQWLDCNNSFAILPADTNQSYMVTTSGDYAVEIIENGCVDTSACNNVIFVGVSENSLKHNLILYPNPTEQIINVQFDVKTSSIKAQIEIFDITGKVILSKQLSKIRYQLDLNPYQKGIYFYKITVNDKLYTGKLIKE